MTGKMVPALARASERAKNLSVIFLYVDILKIGKNMIFWHKIVIFHTK
jgi:hypothetical protein